MSHQPYMHYRCNGNGCREATEVPMQNTPVTKRLQPPSPWVTLWLDDPDGAVPLHLCPSCAGKLAELME
jgi:hypothetical protein